MSNNSCERLICQSLNERTRRIFQNTRPLSPNMVTIINQTVWPSIVSILTMFPSMPAPVSQLHRNYVVVVLIFAIVIGSVHPSESGTIALFQEEKGESQLDEKGNVFNIFHQLLPCGKDIYSPFSFIITLIDPNQIGGSRGDTSAARFKYRMRLKKAPSASPHPTVFAIAAQLPGSDWKLRYPKRRRQL